VSNWVLCFNNPVNLMDPLGLCSLEDKTEYLHAALAAAGLFPLLGIFPDLLDTLLYLLEGDLANAGLSAVAVLPGIGQLSRLGQYLKKLAKYKDKLLTLGKTAWKYAGDLKNLAAKYGSDLKKWVSNKIGAGAKKTGQFRDAQGKLRNSDGTFAYDGGPKTKTSNSTHGNTAGDQPATLYERYDADGNFLKHGISQDPSKRYTQNELDGGYLIETQTGPRKDILKIERDLVETNPGPLNKEPWAGSRKGQ